MSGISKVGFDMMNYGLGNMMMGGGSAADGMPQQQAPNMGQALMPMGTPQPQGNQTAQMGGLGSMLGGKLPQGLLAMLMQPPIMGLLGGGLMGGGLASLLASLSGKQPSGKDQPLG